MYGKAEAGTAHVMYTVSSRIEYTGLKMNLQVLLIKILIMYAYYDVVYVSYTRSSNNSTKVGSYYSKNFTNLFMQPT